MKDVRWPATWKLDKHRIAAGGSLIIAGRPFESESKSPSESYDTRLESAVDLYENLTTYTQHFLTNRLT